MMLPVGDRLASEHDRVRSCGREHACVDERGADARVRVRAERGPVRLQDRQPRRGDRRAGHPDADANGYVAFPRVNPSEDMVDLMSASRGFQANVAAITAVKDMIQRSIDLLR